MGATRRRPLPDACRVLVRAGALMAVACLTTTALVVAAVLALRAPSTQPRPSAFDALQGTVALEPLAPPHAPDAPGVPEVPGVADAGSAAHALQDAARRGVRERWALRRSSRSGAAQATSVVAEIGRGSDSAPVSASSSLAAHGENADVLDVEAAGSRLAGGSLDAATQASDGRLVQDGAVPAARAGSPAADLDADAVPSAPPVVELPHPPLPESPGPTVPELLVPDVLVPEVLVPEVPALAPDAPPLPAVPAVQSGGSPLPAVQSGGSPLPAVAPGGPPVSAVPATSPSGPGVPGEPPSVTEDPAGVPSGPNGSPDVDEVPSTADGEGTEPASDAACGSA